MLQIYQLSKLEVSKKVGLFNLISKSMFCLGSNHSKSLTDGKMETFDKEDYYLFEKALRLFYSNFANFHARNR